MTLHDLELTALASEETGGMEHGAVELLIAEILRLRSEVLVLLVELAKERGEAIERAGDRPGGYYHRGPLPDPCIPF